MVVARVEEADERGSGIVSDAADPDHGTAALPLSLSLCRQRLRMVASTGDVEACVCGNRN